MELWCLSVLQNAINLFFKYLLEKLKLSFSLFLVWSLVTSWTLGQDGQFPPYKLWVDVVVVVGSRWAGGKWSSKSTISEDVSWMLFTARAALRLRFGTFSPISYRYEKYSNCLKILGKFF